MATSTPPLPPPLEAQASPQPSVSPFLSPMARPGAPSPGAASQTQAEQADSLSVLENKIRELQSWIAEVMNILRQSLPAAQAFLVPIIQAGRALQEYVTRARQSRTARTPAAQPGSATPTEGTPVRPVT